MATFTSTPENRILAAALKADVPVLLWGGPGLGKTEVTTAMTSAWGFTPEVVIGSIRQATDFLGLPVESANGDMSYTRNEWVSRLNDAEAGLLFLDELTTSPMPVMRAMLRIVQERIVGTAPLADHVRIVAAANPAAVSVGGMDLPAPIANRFCHVNWRFDQAAWASGLLNGFTNDPETFPQMEALLSGGTEDDRLRAGTAIVGYLNANPTQMAPAAPTDMVKAGRAWASPRSWANLTSILSHLNRDDVAATALAIEGTVGPDVVAELLAYLEHADMPSPTDILADPDSVEWSQIRPDVLFGICTALVAVAEGDRSPETWDAAANALSACAEAGKPDVPYAAMRRLVTILPRGHRIAERPVRVFGDLLTRLGKLAS